MRSIYLDHSATTPLAPEVLDAMLPVYRDVHGNASSVHEFGRKAKTLLEESRETIAAALGVSHEEILFTSGGTESDNAALRGVFAAAQGEGKNEVVISAVEHHAVLAPAEWLEKNGATVTVVPVNAFGAASLDDVRSAITAHTCLISVMHANNEVGTINRIGEIAGLANEREVAFHTDAVQSFGKLPLDLREIPANLVSITAHKLYGPKGIGALMIRKGTPFRPQIIGGAQEGNRRAGTENVPLAVFFEGAVEIAMERRERDALDQAMLRDSLRKEVVRRFPDALFNGHPEDCLPHILSVSFPWELYHIDGEALIAGMDLRGVAVTSGSACTSGTLQPSHVLKAMGRDEKSARATVRFSLGRSTTKEDIRYAADALEEVVRTAKGGK